MNDGKRKYVDVVTYYHNSKSNYKSYRNLGPTFLILGGGTYKERKEFYHKMNEKSISLRGEPVSLSDKYIEKGVKVKDHFF